MYSVVVLMALQGSVDVPDFGRRGGCGGCYGGCYGGGRHGHRHGCSGCYGGGYGGCYGGGYGGCYGGGYGGCYGGGYGGCYGGGCYGGGYGGCYGGGVVVMPGAGGGTGNGMTGGTGGTKETDLTPAETARFNALTKTWDAKAKADMLQTLRKLDAAGRQETFKIIEEEAKKKDGKGDGKGDGKDGASEPAPARLLVVLPANATLRVDDYLTRSTSSVRQFETPVLAPGQDYHYTLTAEIDLDGARVSHSQRIRVRAGELSRAIIAFPKTAVAAK
jgi:uncharacterized protein (TIGR03000 family)